MKKIYHLGTCNTCQKIIKGLNDGAGFEMQDIKTEAITEEQLQQMYDMAGSYEALFSRRAMKYRSLGLNEQNLGEEDYKKWILEEYTFLKRPVIIIDDAIFIGNAKKAVNGAKEKLGINTH